METAGFWELPDYLNPSPIKMRFVINKNPVPKTDFTMETLADAVARQGYTVEQHGIFIQSITDKTAHMCEIIENNEASAYVGNIISDNHSKQISNLESRMAMMEAEHAKIVAMLSAGFIREQERANAAEAQLSDIKVKQDEDKIKIQALESKMTTLYDKHDGHSDLLNATQVVLCNKINEYSGLLNNHADILTQHSDILNNHAGIFNEYSGVINGHANLFDEVFTELHHITDDIIGTD